MTTEDYLAIAGAIEARYNGNESPKARNTLIGLTFDLAKLFESDESFDKNLFIATSLKTESLVQRH